MIQGRERGMEPQGARTTMERASRACEMARHVAFSLEAQLPITSTLLIEGEG